MVFVAPDRNIATVYSENLAVIVDTDDTDVWISLWWFSSKGDFNGGWEATLRIPPVGPITDAKVFIFEIKYSYEINIVTAITSGSIIKVLIWNYALSTRSTLSVKTFEVDADLKILNLEYTSDVTKIVAIDSSN